jgi:hypothetical protein
MREITVKEMVERIGNEVVDVESIDVYGVSVNMSKASIVYDDEAIVKLLTFAHGDSINGGMSVSYEVDGCIECVTYDEEDDSFTVEFNEYMADLIVTTTRKIRRIKRIK